MPEIRTLALFNFLILSVNFIWIILIDSHYFYGHSIESAVSAYPTYLSPANFTYYIWTFLAANMILVGYLMFRSTQKGHYHYRTIRKIKNIGNLMIINQMFLGLSMVLKLNGEFLISIVFSLGCLFTILLMNKKIEIHRLTSNSFTRYFIRLGFGMYTGWMIILIAFNTVIIFPQYQILMSPTQQFWSNTTLLVICTAFGLYYATSKALPTVSAVLTWALCGILYQNITLPLFPAPDIKPLLYVLISVSSGFTLYNFYVCNMRRSASNRFKGNPTSIS